MYKKNEKLPDYYNVQQSRNSIAGYTSSNWYGHCTCTCKTSFVGSRGKTVHGGNFTTIIPQTHSFESIRFIVIIQCMLRERIFLHEELPGMLKVFKFRIDKEYSILCKYSILSKDTVLFKFYFF